MRSVNRLVVLGAVAALLAGSSQVSLAADTSKDKGKEPALKPKEDRGVSIGAHKIGPVGGAPLVIQPAVPVKHVPQRGVSTAVVRPVTPIKAPGGKTAVIIKKPAAGAVAVTKPVVSKPSVVVTAKPPTTKPAVIPVSTASAAPFITAWLDRPGNSPKYKVGDKMVVNVSSTVDCNVVVFNYDAKGSLTQIFPNELQKEGRLRAGQTIQIGGDESPFDYHISGTGGTERIFVYAYPQSQNNAPVTVAMSPSKPSSPFKTANNVSMDQYVAMVRNAQVFTTRGIEVVAKKTTKKVSNTAPDADPNKLELTFQVEQ